MRMSVGSDLTELHRLHGLLRDVREELARGPRQLKAREQLVATSKQDVLNKQELLKQTRMAADRKALELRTLESKLEDLRAKLNQASSNREYDILRGQVDADVAAKAVLEDEILDHLERVDRLQKDIAAAQDRVTQAETDKLKFAGKFEAEAVDLKAREANLHELLARAESVLTGEPLAKYRRLVDAYGAEALASVESGVCTGCYVSLTPQQRVFLNSGQILFCSSCGRLMYLSQAG
jgi:predicted  nucleic acid-binding Zn-ribbon protein